MSAPQWKRTACPYDCPDTCGLLVQTDGQQVLAVKGDPEHPVTKGFLCRKMAHYERTVHNPQRLSTPLRRTGQKGAGAFEPVSWDDAIAEIAGRWQDIIARWGAEAILPYSYAGTELKIQNACGEAFFHYLGASRLERTICAGAKEAGFRQIIGATPGRNAADLSHCDYIILWGSNVPATWLHAEAEILEAKKRGAHVALIETYRSPAASLADEVLLIRPGTDACLALAMDETLRREGWIDYAFLRAHTLGWEEFLASLTPYTPEYAESVTAVPRNAAVSVARGFAAAKSPAVLFGTGPSRHENGAMTIRCITTLPALAGAFAKPYGGIVGNTRSAAAFPMEQITRPDWVRPGVRTINMNQLGNALTRPMDPPVMSLYVYNSNPACIAPDQSAIRRGLAREDLFTVVHERFLTDTAKYADIVLPAATSLEYGDLAAAYGNLCVQKTERVLAPRGDAKSNWDTFALLARAMGFTDPYFAQSEDELKERVAAAETDWLRRWTAQERRQFDAGFGVLLPAPDPCAFQTASGKLEFLRPDLPQPLPCYLPERDTAYPLRLIAAPRAETLNGSFNERPELTATRGEQTLLLSPPDAAARGIEDGSLLEAYNDLACVVFRAAVTDRVLPGAVVAEGVYTKNQSFNGLTVNALFSQRLTDHGRAATLCGNRVEVRPAKKIDGKS